MSRLRTSESSRFLGAIGSVWRAKLGRCQRCQRIAGWGALGSWSLCLLSLAANAPPWSVATTAAVAGAFSLLLTAHVLAFAGWMARSLRAAQPSGAAFEPWTRGEFALLVARLTFVNVRTALFGAR